MKNIFWIWIYYCDPNHDVIPKNIYNAFKSGLFTFSMVFEEHIV